MADGRDEVVREIVCVAWAEGGGSARFGGVVLGAVAELAGVGERRAACGGEGRKKEGHYEEKGIRCSV